MINPDYRYNYSTDGTDTIRHQIRVVQADTLGVDSIRFGLNLIGVVCDTCPASLGGPCDGCFVRVNQPQFLGYDGVRTGEGWRFNGRDTFLLKPNAAPGATWPFDPGGSVTALVDAVWEGPLFGTQDSIRRIITTAGDTIEVSRSFGIARFVRGNQRLELIGVEGLGVGSLLPDPLAYFDFQPGDELVYSISYVCTVGSGNAPPYPGTCSLLKRIIIVGRSDMSDAVHYTTSVAGFDPPPGSIAPNWPMPSSTWAFSRGALMELHPILSAYPGQVLDTSICEYVGTNGVNYIAAHGLTSDGRSVMYARNLRQPGSHQCGFESQVLVSGDLHPLSAYSYIRVRYEERLGLTQVVFSHAPHGVGVVLVGAILAGDTIIQVPSINWLVGLDEQELEHFSMHPNPADEALWIHGANGSMSVSILDMEGRMALHAAAVPTGQPIQLSGLAPGAYLVRMEGYRPQRLIIAR